jgi:hypothetical protein
MATAVRDNRPEVFEETPHGDWPRLRGHPLFLSYINAGKLNGRLSAWMAAFLFRCPNTALNVQGWSADEISADEGRHIRKRDLLRLPAGPSRESGDWQGVVERRRLACSVIRSAPAEGGAGLSFIERGSLVAGPSGARVDGLEPLVQLTVPRGRRQAMFKLAQRGSGEERNRSCPLNRGDSEEFPRQRSHDKDDLNREYRPVLPAQVPRTLQANPIWPGVGALAVCPNLLKFRFRFLE